MSLDVLPAQGRVSWPGWPAAGCTAVGCTEGRTEGRGTLPVGPQLLTLQLASWGLLKYHGQSAEPLLSLVEANNYQKQQWCRGKKHYTSNIQIQWDVFKFKSWCHCTLGTETVVKAQFKVQLKGSSVSTLFTQVDFMLLTRVDRTLILEALKWKQQIK